jgi:hypothetical protein
VALRSGARRFALPGLMASRASRRFPRPGACFARARGRLPGGGPLRRGFRAAVLDRPGYAGKIQDSRLTSEPIRAPARQRDRVRAQMHDCHAREHTPRTVGALTLHERPNRGGHPGFWLHCRHEAGWPPEDAAPAGEPNPRTRDNKRPGAESVCSRSMPTDPATRSDPRAGGAPPAASACATTRRREPPQPSSSWISWPHSPRLVKFCWSNAALIGSMRGAAAAGPAHASPPTHTTIPVRSVLMASSHGRRYRRERQSASTGSSAWSLVSVSASSAAGSEAATTPTPA